jgi:glycosyltransferase involved in cell wall biosynthesis
MNYRGDVLTRHLARASQQAVHVICPRPEVPPPRSAFSGVRFHYLNPYRRIRSAADVLMRGVALLEMVDKVSSVLRSERFVSIRTISTGPTIAGVIARRGRTIPIIANVSDFYGDLYRGSKLPLSRLVAAIVRTAERLISRVDLAIVDTPEQRAMWATRGLSLERCVVSPHGLPRTAIPTLSGDPGHIDLRCKFQIPDKRPIAIYVGDMSEGDGIDVLMKAIGEVRNRGHIMSLVLVGSGTERIMRSLERLGRTLSLHGDVHWIESVPNSALPQLFQQADVCVAPFRATDTTATAVPNKVLEYLTSDLPIIVTGGSAVQGTFGPALRYFGEGDVLALSEQLEASIRSDCRLTEIESRLRADIRESFGWPRIMEVESRLIDRLFQ